MQLGVALDTSGEGLLELESELREDLAKLLCHFIVSDEDGAHDASLDDAALGQVPVSSEQHTALRRGFADQLCVSDACVIGSVVSERTQPAREPPDVAVGQEPGLHLCNLRIGAMATLEDLMTRLRTEASGCYSWSNGPNDRYTAHSHTYEKVLYCVEGSITFALDAEGRTIELQAGDRMVLPAGTVHSAVVGAAGCTCIEGKR